MIITWLLVYQMFWASKIIGKNVRLVTVIISLVIAEIAWSIAYLPFAYNISGLILAICYYIIVGLAKDHLLGKLDKKSIKFYLIFGFLGIIIILAMAKWTL
jgi:hypothetical protein